MGKKRTIVTQYSYNKGVEYDKQKLIKLEMENFIIENKSIIYITNILFWGIKLYNTLN